MGNRKIIRSTNTTPVITNKSQHDIPPAFRKRAAESVNQDPGDCRLHQLERERGGEVRVSPSSISVATREQFISVVLLGRDCGDSSLRRVATEGGCPHLPLPSHFMDRNFPLNWKSERARLVRSLHLRDTSDFYRRTQRKMFAVRFVPWNKQLGFCDARKCFLTQSFFVDVPFNAT